MDRTKEKYPFPFNLMFFFTEKMKVSKNIAAYLSSLCLISAGIVTGLLIFFISYKILSPDTFTAFGIIFLTTEPYIELVFLILLIISLYKLNKEKSKERRKKNDKI